jgi:endothelin-converting enzyme/putative endopeptidase
MKVSLVFALNLSLCFWSLAGEEKTPAATESNLLSGVDMSHVDDSVRPQDDFFSYVNGGWINATEIPADKIRIGAFMDLRESADEDVRTIIEEVSQAEDLLDGSDEQKVADLFRSYTDVEKLNELGVGPLKDEQAEIASINNKEELAAHFAKGQAVGVDNPLAFYISIDAKDSTRYATHIWQSGLGLPDRDYYFNEGERFQGLREKYVEHIGKMFDLVGLPEGQEAAGLIMALETRLAGYHWTPVQCRDSEKRYNKFQTVELSSVTNLFSWSDYLGAQGVASVKDIILNQPDFIEGFGKIFDETSLEGWKIYLNWKLISGFAGLLSEEVDQLHFEFFGKLLNGRQEQEPRWKRGVKVVNGNLGEVIGKIYVAEHFKPEAKKRMRDLVENLRNAYGESIDGLEWMSESTKEAAKVKLAGFTPKIGYPDKWEDYGGLTISRDDLVGNIIRSREDAHEKDLSRLGGPIRKWEWFMTPQTVNAYYSPTRNEIVFPAAILQPPFFNMEADDAVNYGGIGAVIGHEMGHGFDDQGSRYDAEGNMRNWWTESDLEEFKKRTERLIAQYSNYQVFPDLNINGELTLGENIGDLSGVTIAYRAYKISLKGEDAPIIDGLTGDQRFFLGFAQIWRGKTREEAMRNRVATDPHSPAKFRVLGPLPHVPEFYEAFDVTEGDSMYISPEQRVKVW